MTSTFNWTNSAAISAARELRPSAQRYSIVTVRPSIQPRSRSRCTKAATHWLIAKGVLEPKNPMVRCFANCCARAASGHAAAPPTSVMNSRRLIASPQGSEQSIVAGQTGRLEVDKTALGDVRFGSLTDIGDVRAMSALLPKADIGTQTRDVR